MAQWCPSLLVLFHLTFLVDTYTYNSTPSSTSTAINLATSSPAIIDVSTLTHSDIPVSTVSDNRASTAELLTVHVKGPCTFRPDDASLLCDASKLSGCPNSEVNVTQMIITANVLHNKDYIVRKPLQGDCFKGMEELSHLTINRFGLSELFNDTFFEAASLEYLDLSYNYLESISGETFMGLESLMSLDLSYNRISRIDKFFNLPKLTYLSLANNNLVSLPPGVFEFLPELKVLHLDGNDFSSLSSGSVFLGLGHLREMYMNNCKLAVLAQSIFDHTQSLESLYLSRNRMVHIPSDSIRHLYLLQHLDLSMNAFTDIPQQAFQGLALHKLDLSNNSITTVAHMAFRNFRTDELYLRKNRIKVVPSKALGILGRDLHVIDLSGNPLEGDHCIFPRELVYLQKLNLSGNDLPHIPNSILHLYQLQTLDISFNHISTLNDTELKLVRRLEAVYLHGNPWICDCQIRDLKHVLQQQNLQYSVPEKRSTEATPSVNMSKVVCERPLRLSGVPVVSVPEELLGRCTSVWSKVTPVFLYVICSFIIILILALAVFMWQKRHEMAYGRFCVEKGTDSPTRQSHSPIKVISNTAAGAPDLSNQGQGPVKNQAWESALVITNPHSKMIAEDEAKQDPTPNGRFPGAETIL